MLMYLKNLARIVTAMPDLRYRMLTTISSSTTPYIGEIEDEIKERIMKKTEYQLLRMELEKQYKRLEELLKILTCKIHTVETSVSEEDAKLEILESRYIHEKGLSEEILLLQAVSISAMRAREILRLLEAAFPSAPKEGPHFWKRISSAEVILPPPESNNGIPKLR